jgi:hypothetical protein
MRQSPRSRALPPQAAAVGAYRGYRSLHQGRASAGPALDTLLLAAPIAFKGRLVQCAGPILRLHPGKTTADPRLPRPVNRRPRRVAGQAFPGYIGLGFPDPSVWLLNKHLPPGKARPGHLMLAPRSRSSRPVHATRLHARRRVTAARPGPDDSRVQWYVAAPGMTFPAPRSRLAREVNTVGNSCWYAVTWLG